MVSDPERTRNGVATRKYVFLLNTNSKFWKWGFNERLVYSDLAHLAWCDDGASVSQLAERVGLDRRTVAKSINVLRTHGLVKRQGHKWWAIEPGSGLFVPKRDTQESNHWRARLANSHFYVPATGAMINGRRFTVPASAVFSMLASFAASDGIAANFCLARLCSLLNGLDPKTIRSALDDLQVAGLLRIVNTRSHYCDVKLEPLGPDQEALFQRGEKVQKPRATKKAGSEKSKYENRYAHPDARRICDFCEQQGLNPKIVPKLVEMGLLLEWNDFLGLAARLKRENSENRKGNPDFGGLLLYELKKLKVKYDSNLAAFSSPIPEANEEREAAQRLAGEIDADPIHPRRTYACPEDLTNRVAISDQTAKHEYDALENHVAAHSEDHMRFRWVLGRALKRINNYYLADTKATLTAYQNAVNSVLKGYKLPPLYDQRQAQAISQPTTTTPAVEPNPVEEQPIKDKPVAPQSIPNGAAPECTAFLDDIQSGDNCDSDDEDVVEDECWNLPVEDDQDDDDCDLPSGPIASVVAVPCDSSGSCAELSPEFLEDLGILETKGAPNCLAVGATPNEVSGSPDLFK
jgi:biotin operon repressor